MQPMIDRNPLWGSDVVMQSRTVSEIGYDAFAGKCFIEHLCLALWALINWPENGYPMREFKYSYLWGKM